MPTVIAQKPQHVVDDYGDNSVLDDGYVTREEHGNIEVDGSEKKEDNGQFRGHRIRGRRGRTVLRMVWKAIHASIKIPLQ
uniref:Uncharacterized protein n=1 Tax=Chenopodium quinoa TaxID=63459 RepID=A0A803N777_CHEQI